MTRARILQLAFLWLIVSAMVWLTTIWRWQNQGAEVGLSEILLQLLLVPLVLAAVLGGAIWGLGLARQRAAEPVKVAPRAAAGGAAASLTAPAARPSVLQALPQPLDASLACAVVLSEHVHLCVGAAADPTLDALLDPTTRPGLDDRLQDVDGLPVFAARCPELDTEGFAADTAPQQWPDEAARALTLLAPVLHEALDALMQHAGPEAEGWQLWQARTQAAHGSALSRQTTDAAWQEADRPHHLSGVARPESPAAQLARQAQAPMLTIVLALPHWPQAVREQAVAWVKARCGVLLDWAEAMSARGVQWVTQPLGQNEDLWREVDQTLLRWQRETRPELMLVIAADSALSPDIVERMQAKGELFTAQHQSGRMPGEGAAALLLGSAHWLGLAAHEDITPPPEPEAAPPAAEVLADAAEVAARAAHALGRQAVRLGRPILARRDKSADAHGRSSHAVVQAALAQVQARLQPASEALHIVADADHRASRCAEVYEALAEVAPDVDPMLAIARVGVACGDLGVAGALVPAALAAAWARRGEPAASPLAEPVTLALHVQASHERVLVPLQPWRRPWSSPAESAPSPASA